MKKWAIGCGIALAVVLIVLAAGAYWVYRQAQPFVASITQIAQIDEIEKEIANQSAFAPPESGELTEDQVARFVKVEEHIQSKLGARTSELKEKYDRLEKAQESEGRETSFAEGMMALRDLGGILVDGKRAQVEALNQSDFSLEEFRWVRGQMYAAAGIALGEIDFSDFQSAAQQGGRPLETKPVSAEGEVPERNKELVKPHLDKLREWMVLGFFGL